MDDGLGLEEHEARPQEEHPGVEVHPALGRKKKTVASPRAPSISVERTLEVRDQPVPQVDERPVVRGEEGRCGATGQGGRADPLPFAPLLLRQASGRTEKPSTSRFRGGKMFSRNGLCRNASAIRPLSPATSIANPDGGGGLQDLAVGEVEDDRLGAEHLGHHRRHPLHDPALPQVIVRHEHAAGLEDPCDVGERLLGEQEALQADVRVAAVQDQRVDQRIDDQVVLPVGGA